MANLNWREVAGISNIQATQGEYTYKIDWDDEAGWILTIQHLKVGKITIGRSSYFNGGLVECINKAEHHACSQFTDTKEKSRVFLVTRDWYQVLTEEADGHEAWRKTSSKLGFSYSLEEAVEIQIKLDMQS